MRYISAEIWVFGISCFLNSRCKVYLPFLSLWLHIPKRMNLDRFMLFKNKVQLKVLIRVKKTTKGDNGDVYMRLLNSWLCRPLNSCFVDTYGDSEPGMTSVTSGKSTWHADRSWQWPLERFFCRFPVFLYRLGEPKPTEKWSTYMNISEGSFSDFKTHFVLDGYGGIFRLVWSIKRLIRQISLVADLLLSAQKTSGEYTRILCWKITLKNTSLSVSFPG